MKSFFKLLARFAMPYKGFIGLNLLFNLLSTLFSLFAFAMIIPILEILFNTSEQTYTYMGIGADSFDKVLVNNFYYYVSTFIDQHGAEKTLVLLGIFLIVLTFFKTATAYFSEHFLIPLRTGMIRDIRNMMFNKIVSLPMGFFSNERKGDVIARMSGDVNEVENSITASLGMISKNPIMILVYLGTMLVLSWQLTLFVLILLPLSGLLLGKVGKKLKAKSLEGQTQWGGLMSQLEEMLGGMRVIKAFNAEKKIGTKFVNSNEKFRKITNRITRRYSLAHPLSEFLGTATIAIVMWYGGALILNNVGGINAATFIYYLIVFYSIINPAKELSKASYSIQKGLASMERIDHILQAQNPITAPVNPKKIEKLSSGIEYRDICFAYKNEDWVIKNVTLSIPKGKTIALIGQSGSGKSTMADLLPRFYDVQKGGIFIDNVDIREFVPTDLRQLMGIVNQEAILFNDTIFNNIAFGVESATHEQVIEAAKIANAHEFIIQTENGYETNIGDRGCKLSGGQRQRISIARAILKNPPILILDEATSALDTESERLVQEALEKLMKNRTTLVIAHRLSTIRNADMIYVMHQGKIVEQGTHEQLMVLDNYYKRLVNLQSFQ